MACDPNLLLSPPETDELRRIARMMIPPSDEYGVPGADDPLIFADVVRSVGRDAADVRAALAELASLGSDTVAAPFHASGSANIARLGRLILQCYYRDDRVLRSLGMEPRPPFPKGHSLEQGDWSLLDRVRNRPPLWRDDRKA